MALLLSWNTVKDTNLFNEIRKSFMNEGLMQQLYYYRDADQNEIDLVLGNNEKFDMTEFLSGKELNTEYLPAVLNLKFIQVSFFPPGV